MSEPNTIKQVGFSSRKAGRPIRLDKGAIKRLAKYLSGRILKDLFKRPLLDKRIGERIQIIHGQHQYNNEITVN